jgi:hypothetical protein
MLNTPDDLRFAAAQPDDRKALYDLALANGGNERMTPEFVQHWYFENPARSFSIQTVWLQGKPEGFATTNNFRFRIDGKTELVAMPQNVLTSEALRGKGMFQKLYFRTEEENLSNGVDCFLTFTNEMSTPIFLKKFGYERGRCPDVLLYPFGAGTLFSGYRFQRQKAMADVDFPANLFGLDNAVQKDEAFFNWRYRNYPDGVIHIVEVRKGGNRTGYLVLKKEKKKGIPFFLLMDVIAADEKSFITTLKAAPVYATKGMVAFVLFYDSGLAKPGGLHKTIKNRFNFLAKGKTPEETQRLANTRFRFFFGDMDIV